MSDALFTHSLSVQTDQGWITLGDLRKLVEGADQAPDDATVEVNAPNYDGESLAPVDAVSVEWDEE